MFKISSWDSSISSKHTQCSAAQVRKLFQLLQFCTSWSLCFCEPNKEHVQRTAARVCHSLQDLTQILPEILPSASTVGNVITMLHYKVKDLSAHLISVFNDFIFLFISSHVIITEKLHSGEFILKNLWTKLKEADCLDKIYCSESCIEKTSDTKDNPNQMLCLGFLIVL